MKRALAVSLPALLLLVGAAREPSPKPSAVGPRLRVDPEAFDFGNVQPQRSLRKVFTLSNGGDEDLVLGTIRADCGCTTAAVAEATLRPGRSTALTVTLATGDNHEAILKRVLVPSNDPVTPRFEIKLRANVAPAPAK